MSFRKLWIYLAVLLLVAGTWGAVEFLFPPKTEKEKNPLLFGNLSPDKIQEIRWQRGPEAVHLKKNKEWEILQPLSARADTWAVENLLQTLTSLKPERRLSEIKPEGEEFGLNPPRVKISFSAQGKWFEILVGNKTAVGQDFYAKVSTAPDLLLVQEFIIQDLDRDLFSLREKKVFSVTVDQVQSLEFQTGKQVFYLEKTPEGWKQKGRSEGEINKKEVDSFLIEVLQLKVKGFAGPGINNPQWGLKSPIYQLRLNLRGQEDKGEILSLGKEDPKNGLSATSTIHNEVFFLDPAVLKKFPRDLEAWKNQSPVTSGQERSLMSSLLSCLKKRDLLHNQNIGSREFAQYGWDYFKQDRPVDALDFFEKAQDLEGIRQIREWSLEQGDPFLLQQTSKLLKEPVPEDSWRKVMEKAQADGRLQQALTAAKALADEGKIQEIQGLMKSSGSS